MMKFRNIINIMFYYIYMSKQRVIKTAFSVGEE